MKLNIHYKIRDMTIYDIPKVFSIGNDVFTQKDYVFLYRTWEAYEVTGLFSTDAELCVVAETEKEVIGFALGSLIAKPKSAWKYGYLVWIGIDKNYQRDNIGKKLYQEIEKRTKKMGARMMIIDTEGTNLAAIKFFGKMGFKKGSSHLWMTKNLGNKKNKKKEKEIK